MKIAPPRNEELVAPMRVTRSSDIWLEQHLHTDVGNNVPLDQSLLNRRRSLRNVITLHSNVASTLTVQEENTEDLVCRQHQLTLLRQVCIPSLCNLLITVFTSTEGCNKECAKLADVLAAESHSLYEVGSNPHCCCGFYGMFRSIFVLQLFTKSSGKKLLHRIQDALVNVM